MAGSHSALYQLSPTRLFHANRLTIRNTLAIPVRAEACRLMNGRKSHEKESGNANQDEGEQNAHHVGARRIPLRPSHLSIHAASLIGKVLIDLKHAERIQRPQHPFGRGFSRASQACRQNDTDDWRHLPRRKFLGPKWKWSFVSESPCSSLPKMSRPSGFNHISNSPLAFKFTVIRADIFLSRRLVEP